MLQGLGFFVAFDVLAPSTCEAVWFWICFGGRCLSTLCLLFWALDSGVWCVCCLAFGMCCLVLPCGGFCGAGDLGFGV